MALSVHPENECCVEKYIWHVVYQDGTELCEYPDPKTHKSFTSVDVPNVVKLTLYPNPWLEQTGPEYIIACDPERGLRPIMYRQNAIVVETGQHARWHVFGTQQTVKGKNVKSLLYLSDTDPSAPVILTDHVLEIG